MPTIFQWKINDGTKWAHALLASSRQKGNLLANQRKADAAMVSDLRGWMPIGIATFRGRTNVHETIRILNSELHNNTEIIQGDIAVHKRGD